jgi:hypothetical protein
MVVTSKAPRKNFALKILTISQIHKESSDSYRSSLTEQQSWERTFHSMLLEKRICTSISGPSNQQLSSEFVVKTLHAFISPLDSSIAMVMELAIGDLRNLLKSGELRAVHDIRLSLACIIEGISFLHVIELHFFTSS